MKGAKKALQFKLVRHYIDPVSKLAVAEEIPL